jgi:DnaA family protein
MRQLALDIAAAPAPTLENFVPGRNAELAATLRSLVAGSSVERSFYLWGAAGSGRSHLVQAVVAAAQARGRAAMLVDGATLRRAIAVDALIAIDDVHSLSPSAQVELFDLYNRLRAGGGALVATGDAAPAQLKVRPDLATRLGSGLVYQVHALSDDEKKAALARHADERGLRLAPAVIDFLLGHAQRDLPSLLAILDALDRHALATRRAITVPIVRELLAADAAARPAPPLTAA